MINHKAQTVVRYMRKELTKLEMAFDHPQDMTEAANALSDLAKHMRSLVEVVTDAVQETKQ